MNIAIDLEKEWKSCGIKEWAHKQIAVLKTPVYPNWGYNHEELCGACGLRAGNHYIQRENNTFLWCPKKGRLRPKIPLKIVEIDL